MGSRLKGKVAADQGVCFRPATDILGPIKLADLETNTRIVNDNISLE